MSEAKLSELKADPRNARKHTERNVGAIEEALREVGAARSIVIDEEGVVLAGNATVKAAAKTGLSRVQIVDADGDTIIAVRRRGLTPEQKARLALCDNRAAELAEWDVPVLQDLLRDMPDVANGMWSADELSSILGLNVSPTIQEDDVPDVPVQPITQPGDLWVLGNHRLLCGDSTKAKDVDRLMAGARADLCFTSPPYGQQRDYTEEGKAKVADWDGLMRGVFGNLPMTDEGQVLVNLGLIHRDGEWIPYWDAWIEWMREQGWRRFGWYVWDQGPGMPGDWNGRLAPSHEFIWHFNRESVRPEKARDCKHAGEKHGGKGQRGKDGVVRARHSGTAPVQSHAIHDSVFRVNRQGAMHGADGHPAPYPIGLPFIAMQSWPGVAYEPFCGSGTTLIAAEQLGRKCYAMEIAPAYCDVIVARWEQLTGKKATREGVQP